MRKILNAMQGKLKNIRKPQTVTEYIWCTIAVALVICNLAIIMMCIGMFTVCVVVSAYLTPDAETKQIGES